MGDRGIPFRKDSAAVLARPYLTLPCAVVWLHHGFPPRHVRTQDSEKAAGQEPRLAVLLDTLWLLGHCSRAPCAAGAGLHPVPPVQGSPRHQHFGSQSHPQPGLGLMLRAEQPPGPPPSAFALLGQPCPISNQTVSFTIHSLGVVKRH